jgi:hypothetical protein
MRLLDGFASSSSSTFFVVGMGDGCQPVDDEADVSPCAQSRAAPSQQGRKKGILPLIMTVRD